jgi:iron complex outermembrane receptor protein
MTNCIKRFVVCFRVLAAAILFLTAVAPVSAQVDEITVTARLVEENLQEVPLSISSFSEATLEQARIQNINDLANFTPNLTFESGEGGRRSTPVIRGISTIDTRAFDNSVGIFIDGVFVSGRAVQNVNLLDVERVEVVRGPQSALFGRNTFAGAINYVTKKPSNELEGKLEATAAEDGLYQFMGSISGPLIADKLLGRIAARYDEDDGQFNNSGELGSFDNIGGHEYKSISGSLTFLPNDATSITLSGYYADDFLDSRPVSVAPNNCGELDQGAFTTPLGSYDTGVPSFFCGDVPALDGDTLAVSPEAYASDSETARVALDVTIDFDAFRLVSLTSYTETESIGQQDLDRTQVGEPHYGWLPAADYDAWAAGFPPGVSPPPLFSFLCPFSNPCFTAEQNLNTYLGSQGLDNEYWSQEFRLESKSEGPLRWLGGLYFFDSKNTDTTRFGVDASPAVAATGLQPSELQFLLTDLAGPPFPPPPPTLGLATPVIPNIAFLNGPGAVDLTEGTDEVTQYAAFGSLEYDFSDRLTGTAELRYTYEERKINNIRDDFFLTLPDGPTSFEDDWQFWDPRFTLRYQTTDDVMVYGAVARGTRSGGLNVLTADPAAVPYDEETNWTYEVGMKSAWLDNRLQFNLAAFYIDWEDVQIRQLVSDSTGGLLTATTNGTGVTSHGIEVELVATPTDGVTLSLGYGYSNPKYDNGTIASGETFYCDQLAGSAIPAIPVTCVDVDPDGDGVIDGQAPDNSDKQLRRSSKHTAIASAEWVTPSFIEGLDWATRFDVSYRSKQPTDLPATQFAPSRTLANLRTGVQNEQYDVTLWVENLFGEDAIETTQTFGSNFNSFRNVTSAVNINDTRIGVTGRYKF